MKTIEQTRRDTRPRKMIYGVGINDFDGPVCIVEMVGGKQKVVWRCKLYNTWVHMLARCYSEASLKRRPRYADCFVCRDWHLFSNFRAWMILQDYEGNHLDKDILVEGNKVYSPETCVFISAKLNTFLSDGLAKRGKYPVGVCWSSGKSKFQAQCNNPFTGKRGAIGYFNDPAAAAEAYLEKKREYAAAYADIQKDKRVANRLREMFCTAIESTNLGLKIR